MNSRPIVLNLGAIFMFLLALGVGGFTTDNTEPECLETSSFSLEDACTINNGKGLVWEVATGNRNRAEG